MIDHDEALMMQQLTSDDHHKYLQARKALSILPKEGVRRILSIMAESHISLIQSRVLDLSRIYAPDEAAKIAVKILQSPDNPFLAEALYKLCVMNNPVGIDRACELLLTHPDEYVRLNSAAYLGSCGTLECILYLEKAINDQGRDEEEREVGQVAEMAIVSIKARQTAGM